MKAMPLLLSAAALSLAWGLYAADVPKRQSYALDPAAAKANAARVASDLEKAPAVWKSAPAVYYAVDPLSDIKRVPDLYPVDGKLAAPVELTAARGEFEPGSILVYPRKNVDKFELRAHDLKNKNGDTIPASALDLKLVKIWYQVGSGWFGFMGDPLGRTLTPELLVNDENLIYVDPAGKDNYARYNGGDGKTFYEWISADFQATNYKFSNMARPFLMKDADTLQPVVLNDGEFKQFFITVQVPKTARGGIYSGSIDLVADGRKIGEVPVNVSVLAFELPKAATNYDLSKPFMLSLYGTGGAEKNLRILKNLVDHNAIHVGGVPNVQASEEEFARQVKLAKEMGVETRPLMFNGPGVGMSYNPKTAGLKKKAELEALRKSLEIAAALCKKYLGHTDFYCYAADEAGYYYIRNERAAWREAHAVGANVMVSSHAHEKMLYPLDMIALPSMPNPERQEHVRKFHEAHPNGKAGWYADPHSGPENPDYFRRIHGIMSYKANYDMASNYTWYRNNWNDFAIAYEPNYRGIIMVYAVSDRILDTLAWEGVREGMDDVRYATKVKLLAMEAEKSGNADAMHLGRKAFAFLAYYDVREDVNTFRMECVNFIIELEKALGKEAK